VDLLDAAAGAGEAEVRELERGRGHPLDEGAVGEQDVLGLEVAMHQPRLVGDPQALADLHAQAQRGILVAELVVAAQPAQRRPQVAARAVFQQQILRAAGRLDEVNHAHDPLVQDAKERAEFAVEAAASAFAGLETLDC
jgi:hypothetical protein